MIVIYNQELAYLESGVNFAKIVMTKKPAGLRKLIEIEYLARNPMQFLKHILESRKRTLCWLILERSFILTKIKKDLQRIIRPKTQLLNNHPCRVQLILKVM